MRTKPPSDLFASEDPRIRALQAEVDRISGRDWIRARLPHYLLTLHDIATGRIECSIGHRRAAAEYLVSQAIGKAAETHQLEAGQTTIADIIRAWDEAKRLRDKGSSGGGVAK